MAQSQSAVEFSVAEIERTAETILREQPDPIPTFRLLGEVLRLPPEDTGLRKAKAAAEQNKWVHQLRDAQLKNGSWGRFHSQDTKTKSIFRTSEEAIDRAFSLGLDGSHPVLRWAVEYIERVLNGQVQITDRAEKNEAWPLLIRFILAGRLAQIDPSNPMLDNGFECLAEVAGRAFASGSYLLADEAEAFMQVTNTRVPGGFIESQHALWILASRPLPKMLGRRLVDWVWGKPDGIRYLRAPLSRPMPKTIIAWLRSMNILSRFPCWREVPVEAMNELWKQRSPEGLWDFGAQTRWCMDFPISNTWHTRINRQLDYSTCLLVLMRRWFD